MRKTVIIATATKVEGRMTDGRIHLSTFLYNDYFNQTCAKCYVICLFGTLGVQ